MRPDRGPLPGLPDDLRAKHRNLTHYWGWVRENLRVECMAFRVRDDDDIMVTVGFEKIRNGEYANPLKVRQELEVILREYLGATTLVEWDGEGNEPRITYDMPPDLALADIFGLNEADLVLLKMHWDFDPRRGYLTAAKMITVEG